MKERAEVSGGNYEIHSAPGRGTKINVRWHWVEAAEGQCPVIPMSRNMAQAMCKSPPNARDLPEDFAVCLSCVRNMNGDESSERHRH
jgi:hypothetical protein